MKGHAELMKRNSEQSVPLKFGFMGAALDTGNMGVSALAVSVVQLIHSICPKCDIRLFIGNRSAKAQIFDLDGLPRPIPVVNYRNSPKSPVCMQMWFIFFLTVLWRFLPLRVVRKMILENNEWLRQLSEMDLVGQINGGDSFSDIYGLRRFIMGALPVVAAIWLKRKVVMLPQTYGPYSHWLARRIARYILNRCVLVYARDQQSYTLAENLLKNVVNKPQIWLCPDVAFTLLSKTPASIEIYPPFAPQEDDIVVGFNVNGLMYNGGYTRKNMFNLKMDYAAFCSEMLSALLKREKTRIILIPHTYAPSGSVESDPDACVSVLRHAGVTIETRVHLVTGIYNESEIKAIIGMCDFFIGSRMHACIASLSQGIPTAGVAYSKKFRGVFETVGAGNAVVDARFSSSSEAIAKTLKLMDAMKHSREHYEHNWTSACLRVNQIFSEILLCK